MVHLPHLGLLRQLRTRSLRYIYLNGAGQGRTRQFNVLALESSADDKCAAVINSDRKILSNIVISQHTQYGHLFLKFVRQSLIHLLGMQILAEYILFTPCRVTKELWCAGLFE